MLQVAVLVNALIISLYRSAGRSACSTSSGARAPVISSKRPRASCRSASTQLLGSPGAAAAPARADRRRAPVRAARHGAGSRSAGDRADVVRAGAPRRARARSASMPSSVSDETAIAPASSKRSHAGGRSLCSRRRPAAASAVASSSSRSSSASGGERSSTTISRSAASLAWRARAIPSSSIASPAPRAGPPYRPA